MSFPHFQKGIIIFVLKSQLVPILFFQHHITHPFLFPKVNVANQLHNIILSPIFMFLNRKPLPHPFHRRPTHFSQEMYILSFCGVICVTFYHINKYTPTQYFSHGLPHYSTYLAFVLSYNQLNILLVYIWYPPLPSPLFSGLTSPVFFFNNYPSSICSFTISYNPPNLSDIE